MVKSNNDTPARIHAQAHELFMRYGWKSVSMDDIAAKMGISKKTIYQFYSDKESLVSDVVKQIIEQNQKQFDKDITQSENAIHEIVMAMEHMSELFVKMNPSIIFDLHKYYPAAYSFFLRHKNDYVHNKIRDNIKRGIREGIYRPELDVEIIARYRVESIVMAFNPEFQSNVKAGLVNISNQLSVFFLHGVTNEKGQKLIKKYIHIQ